MAIGRRDDVTIRYGADDTRFQRVTKRVKKTGLEVSGFFGKVGTSIGAVFSRGIVGGIGAVTAALGTLGKAALASGDEIAKTADKVGVSIENLQRLRYAASTAGVAQGSLDTALQRFSRRVGEAAQGTGELYKDLERLRIPLRDAQGNMRSNVAILGDYAEAVRNAESSQEKLRLTVKAFDTEGAGLVNLLRQGRDGMLEVMGAADELGTVLDEQTVRHLEAMNQAWSDWAGEIWASAKKALAESIVWLDRQAGSYRTLESITERLAEARNELTEAEERAAKQSGRNAKGSRERVSALQAEIRELEKLKQVLKDAESDIDTSSVVTGDGGVSTKSTKGKSGAKSAGDQLVENRLAAQRGDITNAEYRKRRREIILGSDPVSTLSQPQGYSTTTPEQVAAAVGKSAGVGALDEQLQAAADRFNETIKEGLAKPHIVRVTPEIVGITGADAIEQAATQEGETNP